MLIECYGATIATVRAGILLILLFVGGGRAAAARHYRRAKAHFKILADVPDELALLPRDLQPGADVAHIALGQGESLDHLLWQQGGEMRSIRHLLGTVDSEEGSGQLRGAGRLLGAKEIRAQSTDSLIQKLRDVVIIESGGRPSGVFFRSLAGIGGGTGAGNVDPLTEKAAQAIAKLGIPVTVQYELLDGTTFAGLGPRVGKNSAATIAELAYKVVSKAEPPKDQIVRKMNVLALPPFRSDKQSRDLFVAIDEQAITSQEINVWMHREAPNIALGSRFGNITYRSLDAFAPLDPKQETVCDVAQNYVELYEGALASCQAMHHLVSGYDAKRRAEPIYRDSVELAHESARDAEEFIAAVERSGEVISYTVSAQLSGTGEEIDLSRIDEFCLPPLETLTAATERLRLLRTLASGLASECQVLRDEVAERTTEQSALQADIRANYAPRHGLLLWKANPARLAQDRIESGKNLRATVDNLRQSLALLKALEQALVLTNIEESQLTRELESVRVTLQKFPRRGRAPNTMSSVVTRSVNDAFRDLKHLPTLPAEAQIECLASQVVRVSLAGIAKVVKATEPRVEYIAKKIVEGPYDIVGPFVGATTKDDGQVVYVLPPIHDEPAAELRKQILRLDANSQVFFADFAACGITVIRYRFMTPTSARELFPGTLARDFEEALNDPLKPLFFPEGDDARISPNS